LFQQVSEGIGVRIAFVAILTIIVLFIRCDRLPAFRASLFLPLLPAQKVNDAGGPEPAVISGMAAFRLFRVHPFLVFDAFNFHGGIIGRLEDHK